MLKKEALLQKIRKDLAESPDLIAICESIGLFVFGAYETIGYITYGRIKGLTNFKYEDSDYFKAITYLCGQANILEMRLQFIDFVSHQKHEVSYKDLKEAKDNGYYVHPETGREYTDYKKRIYPFYLPNPQIKAIYGDV